MNIADIKVSAYNSVYDTEGTETDLATFFNRETPEENEKLCAMVDALRGSTDKDFRSAIKKQLPQVCISGTFNAPRSASNLKQHSGVMCIDIDRQDNQHLTDAEFASIGANLQLSPNILFVAHSVGGVGWFCLIPITHPERHGGQFDALKRFFINYLNIAVDISCRDVSRMRCWSPMYPCEQLPNGYYLNENAIPFTKYDVPLPVYPSQRYSGTDKTIERAQQIVEICERTNTDLTGTYDTWYKLGASLSNIGDYGKDFFFRLSRISAKYKSERDIENKWRDIQRMNIDLGYFFNVAKENNIYYT